MKRVTIALLLVLLFVFPFAVWADTGPGSEEQSPIVEDLLIGGVAVGPIIFAAVQLLKRFNLVPDGTAGYYVLGLSLAAVIVALASEFWQIQAQAGGLLEVIDVVLGFVALYAPIPVGALGYFAAARKLQVA